MSLRLAVVAALLLAGACARRAPEPIDASAGATVVEFTPLPESDALHRANPHGHEGKPLCQRCHTPGETKLAVDPIELCKRCHDASHMRHPYGVQQPNPPPDLRLASDGRIVCHTCHEPHSVTAHEHGLRFAYRDLCAKCHAGHAKKPAHPAPAAPAPK